MTRNSFVEGIGNITVHRGIVHIEFVRLKSVDPTTQKPDFETSEVISMTVPAFEQVNRRLSALQEKLQASRPSATAAATVAKGQATKKVVAKPKK
ncbi:MAG: hypothetical protein VW440_06625 [Bordetella sp.]|jgi:hypothetical protein